MNYHEPVMLAETLENLNIKPGGLYIDATVGDGGHSLGILKAGGKVLGLDYDLEALNRAITRITNEGFGKDFVGVCSNFKKIDEVALANGFDRVNGIIYDLGYSSFQLEDGEKGLSFLSDDPLDMRLDPGLNVTAADLVNGLREDELARLIFENSDERLSKRFARAIVKSRNLKKFQTAKQLAEIIASEAPSGYEGGRIHPATRTFQALRIAVNDELTNLSESLPRGLRLLLPGFRMIVISFHSKEDELVKKFGRVAQPGLKLVVKKPLTPTESEIGANVRSRSAKMRIFEKV